MFERLTTSHVLPNKQNFSFTLTTGNLQKVGPPKNRLVETVSKRYIVTNSNGRFYGTLYTLAHKYYIPIRTIASFKNRTPQNTGVKPNRVEAGGGGSLRPNTEFTINKVISCLYRSIMGKWRSIMGKWRKIGYI